MHIKDAIKQRFPLLIEDFRGLRNGIKLAQRSRQPNISNAGFYRSKLIKRYAAFYGRPPDLHRPTRFSEYLCRQMIDLIASEDQSQTLLSDKLRARDIIARIAGPQYLNELYWIGSDHRSIPLESLPRPSIIKTNHGSGGNVILSDSSNLDLIRKKLRNWLASNYFYSSLEYQYYRIEPRVLVERILRDDFDDGPRDYRFFCFYGEPYCIQVDNRFHDINPFYDLRWKKIGLRYRPRARDVDVPAPKSLDLMVELAKKMSRAHPFVRVDFFDSTDGVYFSELTFTPVSGLFQFCDPIWDELLGDQWTRGLTAI